MADEEVKISILVDGQEAFLTLDQFKERLNQTSVHADKSSGALKGFKFAAKEMGHQLGLSGGMSRMFGGELMELGVMAGGAGIAIGGLTIAGIAGYKMYEHFRDEAKNTREELEKHVSTLKTSTATLYENKLETEAVRREREKIAKLDREQYLRKSAEMIENETKAIKEQRVELSAWEKLKTSLSKIGGSSQDVEAATASARKKLLDDKQAELDKRKANIALIKAERSAAGLDPNNTEAERMRKQEWENELAFSQAHMKFESESLAASRQYTADQAMLTQARIDDANRERDAKREAFYNTAGFLSSSFQAMYQAGGAHARKNFSLFKIAASAEALINADRAAASAFAWGTQLGGPGLGGALAALAFAAGMARVKSIRAMTLEGGGGAGGSIPTYTTSPTTGETSKGPSSITININGQKAGEYELASGILRTIYNNNGSLDGFTLDVARTA